MLAITVEISDNGFAATLPRRKRDFDFMATTLVGKLSPKAMGWSRAQIGVAVEKIAETDSVLLGRVAGIVIGLKETVDERTGNIQTGLKGSFKAISTKVDEATNTVIEVRSGVCYLPSGIQDTVEAALSQALDTGAKKASVTFAVDLFAIKANNAAGYSYKAVTLIEASESDPLDAIMTAAAGSPALAAPAPVEALPAPETAPETVKETAPEKAKK